MEVAAVYILSYLLGAVPAAYILGKTVKGLDIRGYGSGNVGSHNVFHHVGRKWAILLGALEILVKGALPVWIAVYVLGWDRSSAVLIGPPLLAVAGHNWSIFLKFQGGRGLAVGIGTLLGLSPILLAAFAVVSIAGWAVTRSSGVWVLIALALLPLWSFIAGEPKTITFFSSGLVVLTALKRLSSNWTPLPQGLPKAKVLFNRLFRDRDIDDQADWVRRVPQGTRDLRRQPTRPYDRRRDAGHSRAALGASRRRNCHRRSGHGV